VCNDLILKILTGVTTATPGLLLPVGRMKLWWELDSIAQIIPTDIGRADVRMHMNS